MNTKAAKTRETGEVFDLDAGVVDGDDEDDNDELGVNGPLEHQLGYYKGELRVTVVCAIFLIRIFLLNMNAYPDKLELLEWAARAFASACQLQYGIHEGAYSVYYATRTAVLNRIIRSHARVH